MAASAVAGLLYTLASPAAAFTYATVLMVTALLVLMTTAPHRPSQPEHPN